MGVCVIFSCWEFTKRDTFFSVFFKEFLIFKAVEITENVGWFYADFFTVCQSGIGSDDPVIFFIFYILSLILIKTGAQGFRLAPRTNG